MKKSKYSYSWALKFLLAAILVGVGIYMVFAPEVVYTITGVGIVIFSIFRVVPLLRSLNKEMLRTIILIEILIDTLIGILLVYIAFTGNLDSDSIWGLVYRYALAVFFYMRGLVYFNSVVFLDEKTEITKFWVHILALSLGAVISVLPQFDYSFVALLLLFISMLGAGYLGFDGYNGYSKYREFSKNLNAGKVKPKDQPVEKENPSPIIDEKEEKRPNIMN